MRYINSFFFTILLLLVGAVSSFGQLKFHVASFGEDQFDLAARDERFKKIDGSGSLYAIIKVSGDDLKEYNFNFGNMNHLVESHEDQLWVYVQKNAKMVTIMRKGYTTIDKYDLRTTIEAGKTYVMQLSVQGPVIYTQMVMFQTEPKVTGAVVMVQREGGDSTKELFGTTDVTGVAAKGLEFGTYTYEVMAENYYSSEGRFTLNNQNETHRENVMLRSNGANITLAVATNADIYINGTKKGTRSWTGSLKTGLHNVECRQENHRPSSQTISVKEGEDQSIVLAPPTPITGVLAITSTPSGAAIYVDGKSYGTTPRNITDLLIGQHTVILSLNGYGEAQTTVDVKEQQTTDINLELKEKDKAAVISNKSESTVSNNNLSQKNTIYSEGRATSQSVPNSNFDYESLAKDNLEYIRKYNQKVPVFKGNPKRSSDFYIGILGIKEGSVLETPDVKAEFRSVLAGGFYQYINTSLTNKTDKIIYVDLGRSFFLSGSKYTPYFVPSSESNSNTTYAQRVKAIPPHGTVYIGGNFLANRENINNTHFSSYLMLKNILFFKDCGFVSEKTKTYDFNYSKMKNGEIIQVPFVEDAIISVILTYALTEDIANPLSIRTDFFLKDIMGLAKWSFADIDLSTMPMFFSLRVLSPGWGGHLCK